MPGKGIYNQAKVLSGVQIIAESDEWFIGDFCLVTVPKLMIGGGSQINAGSKILGREMVSMGRRSVISYDCLLMTSSDTPNPTEWKHNDFSPEDERRIKSKSIVIGSDCFIGAKCVLMPGVVVPSKTVIPAGSYVYTRTVKGAEHLCVRPLGSVMERKL